jgi:putative membrane protein
MTTSEPVEPVADLYQPELDYRFTLANERTFLAWIRTALALAAAAVAVVHIVPATAQPPGLRIVAGVALAAASVVLAGFALHRWVAVERAMREGMTVRATFGPYAVAACMALTGVVAAVMAVQAR